MNLIVTILTESPKFNDDPQMGRNDAWAGSFGVTHTADQYDYAVSEGIKLFMRKGFVNVSIDDIVSASGLNRYAIYSAFGTKLDYFKACVHEYCRRSIASLERLSNSRQLSAADAARQNLYNAADEMCEFQSGCLVCENITAMRVYAPDLAEFCVRYFKTKEDLVLEIFLRARETGELAPHLDPAMTASTFLIFKFGLSNEIKRTPDPDTVRRKIDSFIVSLFPS